MSRKNAPTFKRNMRKSQSSVYLFSLVVSLISMFVSFLIAYSIPVLILSLCIASGFFVLKRKGSIGQAEMLISVLIMLLAAGSVVAYSAYNSTMNSSLTGNFVALSGNFSQNETQAIKTIEKTKTIYIWANTSLNLELEKEVLENNDTLFAKAQLRLDNSTPVQDVDVVFYVDDEEIGSVSTDHNGSAEFLYSLPSDIDIGNHEIKAVFLGREYLNPSFASKEFILNGTAELNISNVTIEFIEISQGPAEVGKPVKWNAILKASNPNNETLENVEIKPKLPHGVKNISVRKDKKKKAGISTLSFAEEGINTSDQNAWNEDAIPPNGEIFYEIEYETSPPLKMEKTFSMIELPSGLSYQRTIHLEHDDQNGTLHYYNVTVRISYDESYDVLWKNGFMDLVWLNGSEDLFDKPTSVLKDPLHNVTFEDTDGNGTDDTLVFTVPKLSGADYGLPGYSCQENTDAVGYTAAKATNVFTWTPVYNCLGEGIDCQMVNFTVDRRYVRTGSGGLTAYVAIAHPNGSLYYPSYSSDIDACGYFDSDTNSIPRAWACDEDCPAGGVPDNVGTCNISYHSFNASSYNVTVSAANKVVSDLFNINYTWCWQASKPELTNANAETLISGSDTGGWGETWNFTVSATDPQGENVSVSTWTAPPPYDDWTRIDRSTVVSGTTYSYFHNYSCSDFQALPIAMGYKFSAADVGAGNGFVENNTLLILNSSQGVIQVEHFLSTEYEATSPVNLSVDYNTTLLVQRTNTTSLTQGGTHQFSILAVDTSIDANLTANYQNLLNDTNTTSLTQGGTHQFSVLGVDPDIDANLTANYQNLLNDTNTTSLTQGGTHQFSVLDIDTSIDANLTTDYQNLLNDTNTTSLTQGGTHQFSVQSHYLTRRQTPLH
jgi:hypothetical protein